MMTLENEKAIDRLRDELESHRKIIRLAEDKIVNTLRLINNIKHEQCWLDKQTDRSRL